jgi:AAHS family 4-hydroxybenzoate transporter-like MFS transporter
VNTSPNGPPTGGVTRVNVSDAIDAAPFGRLQLRVIILCLLVSMLDGFDTQALAFVAPSLSQAWNLAPARLGTLFSVTLLGTAVGAAVFGRLADRYGRRRLLSISVAAFGVMTLACAVTSNFTELLLCRFLAGAGLGGAIPNFLAFASEFAPKRARSRIVVATLWGFPAGASLGALASARLIEHFAWPSVFVLGGVLPLLLAPLLLGFLPESIRFLTLQPSSSVAVAALLGRIDRSRRFDAAAVYFLPEAPVQSTRLAAVFEGRLAAGTLLLGGSLCLSLLLTYLLLNWIPLLFRQLGMPLGDAVLGAAILNLGGVAGGYVFSRLMDRGGNALQVMIGGYLLAALAVASIGLLGASRDATLLGTALVGMFLIGSQMSLTAYISEYYPSALRATGIGFTQAMGRGGSLLGPLLGGLLLSAGVLPQQLFRLGAIPALLVVCTLLILQRHESPRAAHLRQA